jgi:hypothetical protein
MPGWSGALVPVTNAIAGTGLAGKKQMVVVTDHDSKVIARRTFQCRAWDPWLGAGLGRRACHGQWMGWGDGVVRADWAPVACAGAAGRGPAGAVRVRAADGHLVVAAH